ncbi:MAG TPA: hypothetical protein VLL77_12810 [Anaerolineales bacterium]|nr:hypothetical protein [Anaerolineales bacterium]
MSPRNSVIAAVLTAILLSLACNAASPTATSVPGPVRATPYAAQPAAGLCGEAAGDEVVMTLEPGLPDPRCVTVTAAQHLRVVNRTGGAVTVALGSFRAELDPEVEHVFAVPFGEYLLPGVHALQVDPCCGGELWLQQP